jgi:hypothetical protein
MQTDGQTETDGRTDVSKLTGAFRCYAKEPKIAVFSTLLHHLAKKHFAGSDVNSVVIRSF